MAFIKGHPLRCAICIAFLFLPGCMTSGEAILSESDTAVVADLSGTYVSRVTGKQVIVTREGNNRFAVKRGDSEPEEAILAPLDAPGWHLMQLYDGEDYVLAAIRVEEGRVVVPLFATAVQETFGASFAEPDPLRKRVADLLTEKFHAMTEKHHIGIDDEYALAKRPTAEDLIAFFNDCVGEPGILTDDEVLTKALPRERRDSTAYRSIF